MSDEIERAAIEAGIAEYDRVYTLRHTSAYDAVRAAIRAYEAAMCIRPEDAPLGHEVLVRFKTMPKRWLIGTRYGQQAPQWTVHGLGINSPTTDDDLLDIRPLPKPPEGK